MGKKTSESYAIIRVVDLEEKTEKINMAAWVTLAAATAMIVLGRVGEKNLDQYLLQEVADKVTHFLYKGSLVTYGAGFATFALNALIKEIIKEYIEKIEKARRPSGYWKMNRNMKKNINMRISSEVDDEIEAERERRR